MVEPSSDDFLFRGATPTPTTRVTSVFADKTELLGHRKSSSAGSPVLYDTLLSASSSGAQAEKLGDLDSSAPEDSMYGDARDRRTGSPSMPDQSRSNRRRSPRTRPPSYSLHRPSSARTSSSSSGTHGYSVSPATIPENAQNGTTPSGFHRPAPNYPAPTMPYAQRQSYGQYVMPPQQPMNMEHTPPAHFGYAHAYHYPGIQDAGLIPRNIHANYQQALRTPSATYPYHGHSPDGMPGAHSTFPNAVTPPIYPHLNTSPHIHSPAIRTPPGQSGAPYGASGQFHSLQYPSMSPTQFSYPQPFSPSSHMYPGQYAPYARHFSPPQEPDRQGTWWYVPNAPGMASPQYENGAPSFQGHFPMAYATMGHHEMDSPYSAGPTNSPTTSRVYSNASLRPDPQPGAGQEPRAPSPHTLGSAAPPNADSATTSSNERPPAAGKSVVRKSYHPNPPTHRSEWVMWAGNVPSDATHDELWRFFNKTPEVAIPAEERASTGVLSIFLISRSNCAFINFDTEANLHGAIDWFNGKPLRPLDPRCPRLVCRVRRRDDDLKAGVGGQRGMGMHTRWVKEQKGKGTERSDISETSASDERLSTASPEQLGPIMSALSMSSDEEGRPQRTARHSSSSGSFASTNSSILSRYFPNRFFILKSLTQFDLDLSVEKGLWATQKHNEGILDQAYRTSQNVFLIFSVNKSGEFYGYARMAGPVRRGEHRVSWATRTSGSSSSSRSSLSPATGRSIGHPTEEPASPSRGSQLKGPPPPKNFFNTPRLVDESPQPAGSADIRRANEQAGYIPDSPHLFNPARTTVQSAPADLGPRQQLGIRTPVVRYSLDHKIPRTMLGQEDPLDDFELDPTAPIRAIRAGSSQSHESSSGLSRPSTLQAVAEEEEKGEEGVVAAMEQKGGEAEAEATEETWGESFKVEWLCTDKLPFHRTRHIRNPWNHDREVKVSRDGTEVEPGVARRLLDEWVQLAEMQTPPPGKMGAASKRGSKSAPPVAAPVPLRAEERGVEGVLSRRRGGEGKEVGGAGGLRSPLPQS